MTGQELIEYIINNHLENYIVVVSQEVGESSYPAREIEIDNTLKTFEIT